MVKIQPINRTSLVDSVVARIRELIETGKMKPGERLPTESELGRDLGVSRTVVREAVSQLESLGLLSVQRGRGMFVGDGSSLLSSARLLRSAMTISHQDLVHFTEFRNAIECYAARRASHIANDEQIAELERLCTEIDQDNHDDLEAMEADVRFHRYLMSITGNPLLDNLLGVVQEFLLAAMLRSTPKPRDRNESQKYHGAIVQAIKAHDAPRAERAMQEHMDITNRSLQNLDRQRKKSRA